MSNENTAVTKQGDTATAVAAPKKAAPTIRSLISGEEFKAQIAMALPKHITPDRFIRVALTAMQKTPKLLDCTQASLFQSLLTCSQLGIEPDGRMAHLIPYGNVCQLIIDYKGLSALAMRSGEILPPHADVVCENDVFEYDRGEVKKHSIDFRKPRGKAYAVYAIVRYKEGGEKAECMSMDEVDAIRKRSKASGSGPWVTDYNEMAKKTVFRRLSKWLPLSPEFRDAIDADADGPVDISKQVEVMDRTPRNKLFEAAAETTATEAPATAIEATATETVATAVDTPTPEATIDEQIAELVNKLSAAKVTKAMKAAGIAFDEGVEWEQEPLDKKQAVLSLLKAAK
jgi:recombination protein RecT